MKLRKDFFFSPSDGSFSPVHSTHNGRVFKENQSAHKLSVKVPCGPPPPPPGLGEPSNSPASWMGVDHIGLTFLGKERRCIAKRSAVSGRELPALQFRTLQFAN